LSASIQNSCGLETQISHQMADIFIRLFNEKNSEEWAKKQYSGFKKFCSKDWNFIWEGFSVWTAGDIYVDATASATATVRIIEPSKIKAHNEKLLKKNPFVKAKQLFEIYQQLLCEELDSDFEYYCTCEEYYPPVAEDYGENFACIMHEFCAKHGMELIDYEFDGETSNYKH
ncbi:MAG: hypothetical protein Q4G11_07590, partial [Gallicola sp.]|nr:hypothetical protein [Gallicola sp.]